MAAPTIYRLSEEILKILSSGEIQNASNVSLAELKIAIGQCVNARLKAEQFNVNEALGEKIPNGTMLGLYEDIAVTSFNGKSKATLPIKPVKLLRNMGVWAIYPKYTADGNYNLSPSCLRPYFVPYRHIIHSGNPYSLLD